MICWRDLKIYNLIFVSFVIRIFSQFNSCLFDACFNRTGLRSIYYKLIAYQLSDCTCKSEVLQRYFHCMFTWTFSQLIKASVRFKHLTYHALPSIDVSATLLEFLSLFIGKSHTDVYSYFRFTIFNVI